MLKKMLSELTRDQLLGVLSDETAVSTDTLRTLCFVGLGGNPDELTAAAPAAPVAAAPVAAAPVAAKVPPAGKGGTKKGKAAPSAAVAAAAAAATPGAIDPAIKAAIDGFNAAKVGFALADLVEASGASKGRCKTALKNAMAAQLVVNAGDRRFSRYGATAAIAQAASDAARGG